MRDLERFLSELSTIRRFRHGGRTSPHKFVLILAVLDLFENGTLTDNKILFDDHLNERFDYHFRRFCRDGDWGQMAPPFFHLSSAPFWELAPLPGREAAYATLRTSGGGFRRIVENVAYAYFADYAYRVVRDHVARAHLRHWIEQTLWNEWLASF